MKQQLLVTSLFSLASMLFLSNQTYSGHNYDCVVRPSPLDTTELLSAGPWLHKRRGDKVYDSTFVRKFYFMKDGKYKIEIIRDGSNLTPGFGTWLRKGNMLYTEMDGYPGEHENEILKLNQYILLLDFHDKGVIDELVRP